MFQSVVEIGIVLFVCGLVSGFGSRFKQVQIDIFGASNGILLTFLFTLESEIFSNVNLVSIEIYKYPNLTLYTIIILLYQLSAGILIILSYQAYKATTISQPVRLILLKSFCYSVSFFLAILTFFVASILYIYKREIFIPLETKAGELVLFIQRVFLREPIDPMTYLIGFSFIFLSSLIVHAFFQWKPQKSKDAQGV